MMIMYKSRLVYPNNLVIISPPATEKLRFKATHRQMALNLKL
jgi:hypothetical protein